MDGRTDGRGTDGWADRWIDGQMPDDMPSYIKLRGLQPQSYKSPSDVIPNIGLYWITFLTGKM